MIVKSTRPSSRAGPDTAGPSTIANGRDDAGAAREAAGDAAPAVERGDAFDDVGAGRGDHHDEREPLVAAPSRAASPIVAPWSGVRGAAGSTGVELDPRSRGGRRRVREPSSVAGTGVRRRSRGRQTSTLTEIEHAWSSSRRRDAARQPTWRQRGRGASGEARSRVEVDAGLLVGVARVMTSTQGRERRRRSRRSAPGRRRRTQATTRRGSSGTMIRSEDRRRATSGRRWPARSPRRSRRTRAMPAGARRRSRPAARSETSTAGGGAIEHAAQRGTLGWEQQRHVVEFASDIAVDVRPSGCRSVDEQEQVLGEQRLDDRVRGRRSGGG